MRNIVLVGFMGTGKTSVGHALAAALKMEFVDMDAMIEDREARPISDIFATDGEPYFRTVERQVAQELAARNGLVVGTGGGVVLHPENISDFIATGLVVCLQAAPATILDRVAHDTTRPLLAGDDKLQSILAILETRQHLYDALPHQVDTNGRSIEQVAVQIRKLYEAD